MALSRPRMRYCLTPSFPPLPGMRLASIARQCSWCCLTMPSLYPHPHPHPPHPGLIPASSPLTLSPSRLEAIQQCRAVLMVLSPAYAASSGFEAEREMVVNRMLDPGAGREKGGRGGRGVQGRGRLPRRYEAEREMVVNRMLDPGVWCEKGGRRGGERGGVRVGERRYCVTGKLARRWIQ